MKKLTTYMCVAGALTLPVLAQARPVTLNTQLQNYGGNGAYLAIYLTDAAGQYKKTLWVAGKKSKYYKHLSAWSRGSGLKASEFDGVTGASVGSGKSLKVTVDLADVLIDAGYEIRIDSAVEDGRDNPAEVRVPLTKSGAGKPVKGKGYVSTFKYDL
ncbi:DUF2271 domain-containing protein [Massilia solisilvae]|uniref:DUF2271 domain-containing protein n=1 Tax=Massilia solisilvae TaxID=1811225 RepID=A0ABT2BN93_9BURK|nr:DUF2271 domain-containing protein [Massilia solisilvae]MCS0609886.1 DUF2271 domain-containing protein [Massilia solisilvae]